MSKFNDIHRGYNCNIFMLSYRGYGLSTGAPDEKGIKIDAQVNLNGDLMLMDYVLIF